MTELHFANNRAREMLAKGANAFEKRERGGRESKNETAILSTGGLETEKARRRRFL